MFDTKKHQTDMISIVLLLCLLPAVFIGVGSFYIFQLDRLLHDDLKNTMTDLGHDAANIAQLRMDNGIIRLESIAANPILTAEHTAPKTKLDLLASEAQKNSWLDILITDENGVTYSSSGRTMNVSRRNYFKDAMNGNPSYSAILNSPLYDEPVIAHAVPLIKDHSIIGVLIAVESAVEVYFALGARIHEQNNAVNQFMDDNGVLLTDQKILKDNFYAMVAGENGLAYADIRRLIANQGSIERTFNYGGLDSYLIINPLGFSGWSVITIVQKQRASEIINDVLYFSISIMVVMVALLAAYIIYLFKIRKTYKHHRNIATIALHVEEIFYVVISNDTKILYANDSLTKKLDLAHDIPTYFTSFIKDRSLDTLQTFLNGNTPFILPLYASNNQKIDIQWHVLPSTEKDSWILLGVDLSAHYQKIEIDVAKSHNDELQQIIDNLPSPIIVHSVKGEILVANANAKQFLRAEDQKAMYRALKVGLGEKGFEEQLKILNRVGETKQSITSTVVFTDPYGNKSIFQSVQNPLFDKDGAVKSCVSLSTDITATLDLQNKLETDISRFEALLDNCPAGVFFSKNHVIQYCNPKAKELSGIFAGGPSPTGHNMISGNVAGMQANVNNNINTYDEPFTICDPNGNIRQLLITTICTTLQKEQITVVWAMEVTEQRKIEQELIEARDAAESATKAKGDFLATMSHEIRTPMNAILGFLHLFDKSNLSPKQSNYIDKISISAAGLLRIINDILDFSKIEANKMDLELAPFNLVASMNAIHSIMLFTAQEKKLELTSMVDDEVPPIIIGDRERLNQILLNLLGNAIKFTQQGKVSLHVSLQEYVNEKEALINFIVSDTGIGLSEEQAARLFQPFTQADTSTSRRFGGTGLGLVISSRLVELMGGSISLDSKLGEGSTFTCTIRAKIGNFAQLDDKNENNIAELFANKSYAQVDPTSIQGKHVLLVEDNIINQEIATALLEDYKLTLDIASDGKEAIEKVKANHYDLILMDMQMPVMDGLEATRNIRAMEDELPYVSNLPIVAMTANVLAEDKLRCTEAGMDDHIAKPISPHELRNTLLNWLTNKRHNDIDHSNE